MADLTTLPAVSVPAKPFWQSKTLWANVLAVAATYMGYIPVQYAAYVIAAINFVLRLITVGPLAGS